MSELDTVDSVIGELIDYAQVHFTTEEEYLRRYDFPDYPAHQHEHQQFIEKVQDYRRRFVEKKTRISLEIAEFLSDWWRNHILNSDKRGAAFCVAQGAK
jgi:hemerythrin-like metal-binding protein